ncbi:hypothetical protein [Nocardia sp. NPDC127526]|uniref:hypothetical protein n=1 Tax=Nocardia sp. NPDC127526 TaxID=3345393 RepID=UPI00363A8928
MRTVVSEFDTLGSDLGFDSIPWELRAGGAPTRGAEAARRPVADRRQCAARPHPVATRERVRTARPHVVARHAGGRARGLHPLTRVQRAQAGFAALAITALVSALAVAGLIGLAQLRTGDFHSETTPAVEMAPALPR